MSPSPLLTQAVQSHRNGDLAAAEALYRRRLAESPDDPDALRLLGLLTRQKGDDEAAIKLFRRALILRPAMVEAWFNLANALDAEGRDAEAEAAYRRVTTLTSNLAASNLASDGDSELRSDAWNNLGVLLRRRGDAQAAENAFACALAARPDFLAARINRVNALRDLHRLEEAWALCREALAAAPDSLDALDAAAAVLHRLDRLEPALDACRRALEINPAHARALANRGVILADLDRWEDAAEAWRRAAAAAPDDFETWRDWGRVLLRIERFSDAEQALTRAAALNPDDDSVSLDLCRARFAARQDPGPALAALQKTGGAPLRVLRVVSAAALCSARGWPFHSLLPARSEVIETESVAWPRVVCDFPEVFLARVEDATVIPANFTAAFDSNSDLDSDSADGAVILDGLHVYSRASLTMVPGFLCHSPDDRVLWREPGPERRFDDEAILLGGDRNFSHGVLDWLSKLWACAQSPFLANSDTPVLVAADLLPSIAALLEILGVDRRRFVPVAACERLRCRRLWLPSTTHRYQQMNPVYAAWLRRRVFESLPKQTSSGRRLYLSRRGAKTRALLNEAEILERLSCYGVEAIVPEDFSMEAQIRLFAEADLVMGPVGGGSAAVMFAPSGAGVIELTHRRIVLPQYGVLAQCLGQRYRQIVGQTVCNRQAAQTNFDWDFVVPVDAVESAVKEILNGSRGCAPGRGGS